MRDSGATVNGLVPGAYLVELKRVTGRTTPVPPVVNVTTRTENGQEVADARNVSATYFAAEATRGTPPGVLPFETVVGSAGLPYAHVGQIRSDLGVATGFVVKAKPTRNPELGARVVATAAHVVFDDAKLTAAPIGTPTEPPADLSGFATTGLQWLHQRDRGSFEPQPQTPRGFYVLAGYAARRIAERTPGEAAPESQNLDVAALYFLEDIGRGGFPGFLASDAAENEWLLSPALKTLVGYPTGVEIPPDNRGRMHATPPGNVRFSPGLGRTFTTTDIRGSGGNSGGPLCVQFEGGNYYPAAIFLGGTGQTAVRAIDSAVIDLFERAEVSGNTGEHNTNGGVPRLDAPESSANFASASLQVNLGPAEAISRGAKWRLGANGRERADNAQITSLAPGNYTVYFTPVTGFDTPAPKPVSLAGGGVVTLTQPYTSALPPRITSPDSAAGRRGAPLTYQVEASGPAPAFALEGGLPRGLSFDAAAARISGVPEESSRFAVVLRATNVNGTDSLALSIRIAPVLENQVAVVSRGQALDYRIAAADPATSYGAGTLPPGITFDAVTGVIGGVPSEAGVFRVPISITNDGGTGEAMLTLNVRPVPEGVNESSGRIGQAFAPFQVVSPGASATFGASNLPPGLSLDPQTGVISGTPTASGTYETIISATNGGGTGATTLRFVIEAILRVTVNGNGQVPAEFGGESFRLAGAPLAITGTPAPGSFFAGWTGGETSREPTLEFTMRDGLQLEANFVPFAAVKGRYRGLITRTSDTFTGAGSGAITLSRTGAFSSSIKLGGTKYRLRGAFNSSGSFAGAITRKRAAAIDVQLHIDAVAGQQQISGSLDVDGATFTLAAGRRATNKSTSRAARYTVILADGAGDEDQLAPPHGNGFAVLVVSTTGEARVTGTLGDGTDFAAGGSLSENGSLPLHVDLAGDRALTGVLAFDSEEPLESVAGTLHRVTPDARSRRKITALGSRILDH